MKPHWKLGLVLTLLLACCGVGLVVVNPLGNEADRAYRHIQLGLTAAEVEHVIGKPPNADEEILPLHIIERTVAPHHKRSSNRHLWTWTDGGVLVQYDNEGKVSCYCLLHFKLTLLDRVRKRIGL